MILIQLALASSLLLAQGDTTQAPTARRVATMALLAAQEYDLGVEHGRIIAAPEVEEARLFLTEAKRVTEALPPAEAARVVAALDSVLVLVAQTAEPAEVSARVRAATSAMAARLGISLEEVPAVAPLAARGAELFRTECIACHGSRGDGRGPAAPGLDPAPTDLTDADGLRGASPLDFYRRITIGVAGTAMPSFEAKLSADDRWALAVHASLLRLPPPGGSVPDSLTPFAISARLSDEQVMHALVAGDQSGPAARARLSAVRHAGTGGPDAAAAARVFTSVRKLIDSSIKLAGAGSTDAAQARALDAYITFEQVERAIRARDPGLAGELEAAFAELRARSGSGDASLKEVEVALNAGLERAERTFVDQPSRVAMFVQSLLLMLREGLEAILVVSALLTFLVKIGAPERRRDIHLGVAAALVASAITAVLIETVFRVSTSHREVLEGTTMLVAVVVLFYVSYWLLSKMEVAKWTSYVKSRVQDAVVTGSTFALSFAAFLAVYREGFETILFYKALLVSGGPSSLVPVVVGIVVGGGILALVYLAINRFGVRLPMRPFFAATSTFLYFMAFIFAGKGLAELQSGGLVPITFLSWAPRAPSLGMYQTVETTLGQGILLLLALAALFWVFVVAPRRRLAVTSVMVPSPAEPVPPAARPSAPPAALRLVHDREAEVLDTRELIRSLDRIEADVAEVRSEIERMRAALAQRQE